MVAQLETQMLQGKLTLQALWYYVQPPATALREAAEVCCLLSNKGLRGARLLDLLNERASASIGDARARALLRRLLAAAAEPYFQTLRRWLAEGVLDDPAREFFVAEDPVRPTRASDALGGRRRKGRRAGADSRRTAMAQRAVHSARVFVRRHRAMERGGGQTRGERGRRARGRGRFRQRWAAQGEPPPRHAPPTPRATSSSLALLGGPHSTSQTVRVEDVTQDGKAAFWQSRWTLRVGAAAGAAAASKQQGEIAVEVPAFLRAVARPVLDAGRYLNVLRACDRTPPRVMHSELETLGAPRATDRHREAKRGKVPPARPRPRLPQVASKAEAVRGGGADRCVRFPFLAQRTTTRGATSRSSGLCARRSAGRPWTS